MGSIKVKWDPAPPEDAASWEDIMSAYAENDVDGDCEARMERDGSTWFLRSVSCESGTMRDGVEKWEARENFVAKLQAAGKKVR